VNAYEGKMQAWRKVMAAYRRKMTYSHLRATTCTPGSAPSPTLGNEYGRTSPLHFMGPRFLIFLFYHWWGRILYQTFWLDYLSALCYQFIWVETVITVLLDQFTGLRSYKSLVTFVVCVVLCLLGLPLCTQVSLAPSTTWKQYRQFIYLYSATFKPKLVGGRSPVFISLLPLSHTHFLLCSLSFSSPWM